MKSIIPYLNFDGKTREAMTFYATCLGAEVHMQTFKESNMGGKPELDDRIMHARLSKGPITIMASDIQPGHPFRIGNNFFICIDCEPSELDGLFTRLVEGGKTLMAPEDTFWGARFGMLTDKYEINWMFNADKPKS